MARSRPNRIEDMTPQQAYAKGYETGRAGAGRAVLREGAALRSRPQDAEWSVGEKALWGLVEMARDYSAPTDPEIREALEAINETKRAAVRVALTDAAERVRDLDLDADPSGSGDNAWNGGFGVAVELGIDRILAPLTESVDKDANDDKE